jgi:single-stranded-DNA-specific exonuclease
LNKIWKLRNLFPENGSGPNADIDVFINEMKNLKARVSLPDKLARLLYIRGMTDYHKVIKFFKPTREKLYDPLLMKGCDIATKRLLQCIENKEKIMVLGDYDVDGTCGVSMFYMFLKHFQLEAAVYIPDRITEGYGVSFDAIDRAREQGIKLIVTIDCGITAVDKAAYAKSQGIEMIICDHHQPPEQLPDVLAIMDPLQIDCDYPFKYLCGAGVAFKLAQSVCKKLGEQDFVYSLLDFVAIATSSDIVPIVDENRVLVNEGFRLINTTPRPSLKTLMDKIGLKGSKVNTSNIVFSLAPRINAVGRLGDAKRAVELLTSETESELDELAAVLDVENFNRRELDKTITENAFKLYESLGINGNTFSIVLHNEEWHPGVIGIVAARLVEKYNRPSIVMTTVNGVAKGSARSISGFNIYEALKKCEGMLIQFGGHCHAAGLEINIENIPEFRKKFNYLASQELTKQELQPEIDVDMEIEFDEINPTFTKILSFFEPFGPGNSVPLFVTKDVQIIGEVRYAKADTHIFKVRDTHSHKAMDAVFFYSKDFHDKIEKGVVCDICYSVEKNLWNGKETTKLTIKDMKFH